jgi:hypothetical protein
MTIPQKVAIRCPPCAGFSGAKPVPKRSNHEKHAEKKDIAKEAKACAAGRDAARELSAYAGERGREMGLSTTFFQIAIALGGVCLVVKKRWLWYVSLGTGILATMQMFKIFLLK